MRAAGWWSLKTDACPHACKTCGREASGLYCHTCNERDLHARGACGGVWFCGLCKDARQNKAAQVSGGERPNTGARKRATAHRTPGPAASAKWEGETLVVTLPLPPRILTPNGRGHWAAKDRATGECRTLAEMAVRSIGRFPRWEGATLRPVFYWPVKRRRDDDNAAASLKAYRDGIADAGLVSDDSQIHAVRPVCERDADNPRVEIHLTPAIP